MDIGSAMEALSATPLLTEQDLAETAAEFLKGNRVRAAELVSGLLGTAVGGPVVGAAASVLVGRIGKHLVDNATTRFLEAGAAWDAEKDQTQRLARVLVQELNPFFIDLKNQLGAGNEAQQEQLLELMAQSDEHFGQVVRLIHRTVADREGQEEVLAGQQRLAKVIDELHQLVIAGRPAPKQMPFDPADQVLQETIELNRRFFEIAFPASEPDAEERLRIDRWMGSGKTWEQVLERRYVVVLGEAGTGKSIEFKRRSALLRAAGHASCFVDLSELVSEGFDDSRLGTHWRKSKGEATLFLDSLDDAKLQRGTLERAFRKLCDVLGDAWSRVRIVVSCRVSDWQVSIDESAFRGVIDSSTEDKLLVVQIGPLEEAQVVAMATQNGVADVSAFHRAIVEKHALVFAERPRDVTWLASYWLEHERIAGLTELIEENVRQKLRDGVKSESSLVFAIAERAALVLAGIATLQQRNSFLLPDAELPVQGSATALDPRDILVDLSAPHQRELLQLALFDEATYGRVRIHHRSVREFMAAKWLSTLVECGLSSTYLDEVLFQQMDGSLVVPRHLAPVVSWLCLWHEPLREKVIREMPSLLLAHGDPERIRPSDRTRALRSFSERYRERHRFFESFDRTNLERFASPELADAVDELLRSSELEDELAETLLQMAEYGRLAKCVACALKIVADGARSTRVREAAVELVGRVGTSAELSQLRAAVMAFDRCPTDIAASLVRVLYPANLSQDQLLELLDHTEPPHKSVFGGMSYVLEHEVPGAGEASTRSSLLAALVPFVVHVDDKGMPEVAPGRDWLMQFIANLLAAVIVDERNTNVLSPFVLETLDIVKEWDTSGRDMSLDLDAVDDALSEVPALRRALFWHRVAVSRGREGVGPTRYRQLRFNRAAVPLVVGDVDWLATDAGSRSNIRERLIAFDALLWIEPDNDDGRHAAAIDQLVQRDPALKKRRDRVALAQPVPDPSLASYELLARSRKRGAARVAEENRQFLNEKIDVIASGGNFGLSWFLFERACPPGEWGKIETDRLRKEYGDAVARAARQGWINFWRTFEPPLPHERESGSGVPNGVLLGLCGLTMEFEDGLDGSAMNEHDATLAIRYAASEFNHFPAWLAAIVTAKPSLVRRVLEPTIVADYSYTGQQAQLGDVLAKLGAAAPEVRTACGGILRSLIEERDPPRIEALVNTLAIVGADLSETLIRDRCLGSLDEPRRFVAWWSAWLDRDASSAVSFIDDQLPGLHIKAGRRLVTHLAAEFEWRTRRDKGSEFAKIRNEPSTLAKLILIVYTYVSPPDDQEQVDDSPSVRDNAQEFRRRIVAWLADIPGTPTVEALRRLAENAVLSGHRDWFLHLAQQRLESDAASAGSSATDALVNLFRRRGLAAMDRVGELGKR